MKVISFQKFADRIHWGLYLEMRCDEYPALSENYRCDVYLNKKELPFGKSMNAQTT